MIALGFVFLVCAMVWLIGFLFSGYENTSPRSIDHKSAKETKPVQILPNQPPREKINPLTTVEEDKWPGEVSFQVLDASALSVIPNITIRFMSKTRYASHHGSGADKVYLSEDIYQCSISSNGYDALRIPDIEVRSKETTELGRVLLNPGAGVIEGVVNTLDLPKDTTIMVELYGQGRRPCPMCRFGNCLCGFKHDKTVKSLKNAQLFVFLGLAEGVYYLRAFIKDSAYFEKRKIKLAPNQRQWVSINLSEEVAVTFNLTWAPPCPVSFVDEGEELPLEEALEEIYEESEWGPLNFKFTRNNRLIGWANIEAMDMIVDEVWEEVSIMDSVFDSELDTKPVGIDRPRSKNDRLLPEFHEPYFPANELHVKAHSNNLFTLRSLPATELTAEIKFSDYTSGKIPLNLKNWHGGQVPVLIKKASH